MDELLAPVPDAASPVGTRVDALDNLLKPLEPLNPKHPRPSQQARKKYLKDDGKVDEPGSIPPVQQEGRTEEPP